MIKCLNKLIRGLKETQYFTYIKLKNLNPSPGTADWLILMERRFGGYVSGVIRNKVSEKDPRTMQQIRSGGMTGGDRMSAICHGYGKYYELYLMPFVRRQHPCTLVEVGILKGTGLAIWSELFEKGRIIGLDIDLRHVATNMDNLKNRGAFTNNNIELHEFDQFDDNIEYLSKILNGDKIDVFIDDGLHSDEAVMTTIASVCPHLAKDFVYIIEDNSTVHKIIKSKYQIFNIESIGELTIIRQN